MAVHQTLPPQAKGLARETSCGQPVERGEGVAVILDEDASKGWSDGGSEWMPISSRVIKVRLRVAGRWARKNARNQNLLHTNISL